MVLGRPGKIQTCDVQAKVLESINTMIKNYGYSLQLPASQRSNAQTCITKEKYSRYVNTDHCESDPTIFLKSPYLMRCRTPEKRSRFVNTDYCESEPRILFKSPCLLTSSRSESSRSRKVSRDSVGLISSLKSKLSEESQPKKDHTKLSTIKVKIKRSKKPNGKICYLERVPELELRSGKLIQCICKRYSGLQDTCERTGCVGSPKCLTNPPCCGPSYFDRTYIGKPLLKPQFYLVIQNSGNNTPKSKFVKRIRVCDHVCSEELRGKHKIKDDDSHSVRSSTTRSKRSSSPISSLRLICPHCWKSLIMSKIGSSRCSRSNGSSSSKSKDSNLEKENKLSDYSRSNCSSSFKSKDSNVKKFNKHVQRYS